MSSSIPPTKLKVPTGGYDELVKMIKQFTYIQKLGGMLGQYGENLVKEPEIEYSGENVEEIIKKQWGDLNAKVQKI